MKNSFWKKAALYAVGGIVVWILISNIFKFLIGTLLFKVVLPIVVVGAIGYVGYRYVTRNSSALPGRRRTPLP